MSYRQLHPTHLGHVPQRSSQWRTALTIVLLTAIAAVIGLTLGLARNRGEAKGQLFSLNDFTTGKAAREIGQPYGQKQTQIEAIASITSNRVTKTEVDGSMDGNIEATLDDPTSDLGIMNYVGPNADIVGIWGRTMYGLQELGYQEYRFYADGTFLQNGKAFGKDFQCDGTWQRNGKKVILRHNQPLAVAPNGVMEAKINEKGLLQYALAFQFQKNVTYNFADSSYRDVRTGERLVFQQN